MKRNSLYEMFLGLLLICVFVLCSFYIILLGANAYSDMIKQNQIDNTNRVAFDYVRSRINEAENSDRVIVKDNTIIIDKENLDIIIFADEYLREMMVKDYKENSFLDGEKIVKIDNFLVSKEDNKINININGKEMELVRR